MSKVNIMQRLSQTLTKMGSGLTQTAMTGIALKSMTNCCGPSIFPMGRGGCCGGGMGYGIGVTSQMMADPMGFSWLPNPACNYAQNNAYGNMMAYQYGLNLAAQSNAQIAANRALYGQQQQLQKTNTKYAGDLDENQETKTGKAFDNATDKMAENDNSSFSILDKYSDPKDEKKCADEYRTAVSNIAKSYAAEIDNSSGNKDKKVTVEEFVKHEMSKLNSDATDEKKAEAKAIAQTAFDKIDINGDGYADWKELAATVATFDTDNETNNKPLDATITSGEYKKWSTLMAQQGTNEFDTTIRKTYTQLFGNKE